MYPRNDILEIYLRYDIGKHVSQKKLGVKVSDLLLK